ncbi:MAG: hypothetical protein LUM44_06260 [Pyrinomonadaceae bacterium]|nr:hypothetical protein [Pyrinomonadaceae bacterium]
MQINIFSDDRDFILNLYESSALINGGKAEETGVSVEEPNRAVGAFEGWYEIAAALGIIGIPVSIVANLISSWIWESYKKSKDPNISIKLQLNKGEETLEIELRNIESPEDIKESLRLLGLTDDNER